MTTAPTGFARLSTDVYGVRVLMHDQTKQQQWLGRRCTPFPFVTMNKIAHDATRPIRCTSCIPPTQVSSMRAMLTLCTEFRTPLTIVCACRVRQFAQCNCDAMQCKGEERCNEKDSRNCTEERFDVLATHMTTCPRPQHSHGDTCSMLSHVVYT